MMVIDDDRYGEQSLGGEFHEYFVSILICLIRQTEDARDRTSALEGK